LIFPYYYFERWEESQIFGSDQSRKERSHSFVGDTNKGISSKAPLGASRLTEVAVKQAKAKERAYRLSDLGGLYLEVSSKGSKYWRYKYRISTGAQRKEKRLALGVYPEISLKNARDLHRKVHSLVSQGGDPSAVKLKKKLCPSSHL
jgi:hypothetical protein